jgi:hypothetical protein
MAAHFFEGGRIGDAGFGAANVGGWIRAAKAGAKLVKGNESGLICLRGNLRGRGNSGQGGEHDGCTGHEGLEGFWSHLGKFLLVCVQLCHVNHPASKAFSVWDASVDGLAAVLS